MAEILGLGITHQPTLAAEPPNPSSLLVTLADPGMPERLRTPDGWPERMRLEWSDDQGAAHGREHRDAVASQLRKARLVLDEFQPDVVVVWGDDQFENFQEDVVPAFCVMGYDTVSFEPWSHRRTDNHWHERRDQSFTLRGHRQAAKYLATSLLEQSFDVAYAYRPLHKALGHSFGNSLLYLDWDRRGFDYAVVPISVNCFGRRLMVQKGYVASLLDPVNDGDERLDPPSPSPARCFDFGAACARALAASPWRVALVASSSWSHAFLTEKHYYLYPDHEADQRLYRALIEGDYGVWRSRTLAEVEGSGQHELLNWFCLAGAMAELGRRPDTAAYFESSVMNSNKVIATFRAPAAATA